MENQTQYDGREHSHPKILHHLPDIESAAAHLLIASGFDVVASVFSVRTLAL
jgi:hypothetical protein